MRMQKAKELMERAAGYFVHFEEREGGMLRSDYFPERDEPSIADEEDAWKLAQKFAGTHPSRFVNVYVVSGYDWTPVNGYNARMLNRYPTTWRDAAKSAGAVAKGSAYCESTTRVAQSDSDVV